jgi:hypothetical protein
LELDFDLAFLCERDVARADDACAERPRKHGEREATTKMTLNKGEHFHDLAPRTIVA